MKKTSSLRRALWFGVTGAIGLPLANAFAQLQLPGVVKTVSAPSNLVGFMCSILSWIFTAAIVLSIVLILIAAFKYMTGSGDPEKIKSAHRSLMFVAVGIAVAILARTVPILVGNFFISQGGTVLDPCPAGGSPVPPAPGGP